MIKLARFLLGWWGTPEDRGSETVMSFTLEFALSPRFGLDVSPALVAFSELLMLPAAEVRDLVDAELRDNPALERLDPGLCPVCRGTWSARCPACGPAGRATAPGTGRGADPAHGRGDPGERPAGESDTTALRHAVLLETPPGDQPVAGYLIDSLDEHGLLDRDPAWFAVELGVSRAAVDRVLRTIRAVAPPGVGATGVEECLLLQFDALGLDPDDPRAAVARQVIAGHLPALARGRFAAVATALGVSRADVEATLQLIRDRLRPYPAFDGNRVPAARYVVPDVVVRPCPEQPGDFTVELVEAALTRLRVRPGSGEPGSGEPGSGGPGGCTAHQTQQARTFLGQLQDRWETLRRICEYTVGRQRAYLSSDASALEPLTRAEVAVALDLHESTVSRAVADKYALLPSGAIEPLAAFFGVSGGLDGALRTLLEQPGRRLSDQCLADRLGELGHPVARRTVAKHRTRLGYAAAPLR